MRAIRQLAGRDSRPAPDDSPLAELAGYASPDGPGRRGRLTAAAGPPRELGGQRRAPARSAGCRRAVPPRPAPRRRGAPGRPGRPGRRAAARSTSRCGRGSSRSSSRAAARRSPRRCGRTRRRAAARPAQPGQHRSGRRASALLMTTSSGTSLAPISPSTSRTAASCASRVGVGAVDHVQDQVGVGDLLQRRAERLDQLVRQVPDEADGVGQRVRPAAGGCGPAHGRVERGEQRVLDQHVRARSAG